MELKELIREFVDNKIGQILRDEPLKNHTTFRIGGPCDLMLMPESHEAAAFVIKRLRQEKIKFIVIGNGSNLLFTDKGYRGVVVKFDDNLSKMTLEDGVLKADSGANLVKLCKLAIDNSYKGMEELSGIPGNVGGAVAMNAGAYGGEIKDVLTSVKIIDQNSEIVELKAEELNLAYRSSIIQEQGLIVLEATFSLEKGDYDQIYKKYMELKGLRTSKQPLEYPSAGSTFKRPVNNFAGKLIDDAGLRGYRYKNALVSNKHCGFVITDGPSSYEEVKFVIDHVREVVKEKFDIFLETEVKIIGE